MREWPCEHITKMPNWTHGLSEWAYYKKMGVHPDAKFCEFCGATRPEPKKSLAEKLREGTVWTFKESNHTSTPLWETTAQAALEHFSEILDDFFKENPTIIHVEDLKKLFKESL